MHSAVINCVPEMIELFLNRDDVDPNATFDGQTPLHYAVSANREDLVELLLTDKRVDVNFAGHTNSRTPLLEAVILNNDKIIEYLLTAGADPQIIDRQGLSPAMLMECSGAQARDELVKQYRKDPHISEEKRKRPRLSAIPVRTRIPLDESSKA